MTARRRPRDRLMNKLEDEVIAMLGNANLTAAERIKLLETGAKILTTRHKINDDGNSVDGSFFSKQ